MRRCRSKPSTLPVRPTTRNSWTAPRIDSGAPSPAGGALKAHPHCPLDQDGHEAVYPCGAESVGLVADALAYQAGWQVVVVRDQPLGNLIEVRAELGGVHGVEVLRGVRH